MKHKVILKIRKQPSSKFVKVPDPQRQKKEFQKKLENLTNRIKKYEKTDTKPTFEKLEINYKEQRKRGKFIKQLSSICHLRGGTHPTKSSNIPSTTLPDIKKTTTEPPFPLISYYQRTTEPSVFSTARRTTKSLLSSPKSQSIESLKSSPKDRKTIFEKEVEEIPTKQSLKMYISGHFRKNKNPVFIIRQYKGSSVLDNENLNFLSNKTESGVDISIMGKFYKNCILQEVDDVPTFIKVKSHKIKLLIDKRTYVYEDRFMEELHLNEYNIQIKGHFIKDTASLQYTPALSISVKNKQIGICPKKHKNTTANIANSIVRNPFTIHDKKLQKNYSEPKSQSHQKEKLSYDSKPCGFKSLLTLIAEEKENIYECNPKPKLRCQNPHYNKSPIKYPKSNIQNIDAHNIREEKGNNVNNSFLSKDVLAYECHGFYKNQILPLSPNLSTDKHKQNKKKKRKKVSKPNSNSGILHFLKSSFTKISDSSCRKKKNTSIFPLTENKHNLRLRTRRIFYSSVMPNPYHENLFLNSEKLDKEPKTYEKQNEYMLNNNIDYFTTGNAYDEVILKSFTLPSISESNEFENDADLVLETPAKKSAISEMKKNNSKLKTKSMTTADINPCLAIIPATINFKKKNRKIPRLFHRIGSIILNKIANRVK